MHYIAMTSMLQLRQFIHFKKQICESNNIVMYYPQPEAKLYLFIENSTNEVNKLGTLELFNVKFMTNYPNLNMFNEIEQHSSHIAYINYAVPAHTLATNEFYLLYETFKLLQQQGYQYVLMEATQFELRKLTQFYKFKCHSTYLNDQECNSTYIMFNVQDVLSLIDIKKY